MWRHKSYAMAYVLPDLNPIEHAWDALDRRVSHRIHPSSAMQEIKISLSVDWETFPLGRLYSSIHSMYNRWKMCNSVEGNLTSY